MAQASTQFLQTPSQHTATVTFREIWNLTWPQALMMVFHFFVGFTDVVVAGRIGPEVQAAFGIISQCMFLLLVFGTAVASGGVSAMSQALGAKLPLRATRYIGLLIKISIVICVCAVSFGYLFRESIFRQLAVPDSILLRTAELWTWFLISVPGSYISVLAMAIFRSRKNVWPPFFTGLIICIVNALGDLSLGLGLWGFPNLGALGIIYSTIFATYVGCFINIFLLLKKGIITRKSFAKSRWEKKAIRYILKVALPAGGVQVLWQLGYILLFSIVATLPDGVVSLAGLTAGNRIESIVFLPIMAFHMTGSILVGHCLGAGDWNEARRVALKVLSGSVLCVSILALIVYQFVDPIAAFVTADASVRVVTASYLLYNFISIPFTGISMTASGILSGAGATVYTFIIYSASTWLIRLPLAWYLGHIVWGNATGVFIAMLVSQVIQSAVILYVLGYANWYRFASTAKRIAKGVS